MSQHPPSNRSIYRSVVLSTLLAIGSAVGALFFTMDYWVDREVHGHLDNVLQERAQTLQRLLPLSLGSPTEDAPAASDIALHSEFFSVFSTDGTLLRQSTRNAGHALPLPAQPLQGTPRHYDIRLPDGRAGRAIAVPLAWREGNAALRATLVVANDRQGWDEAETRIHTALLFATIVISGLVSLLAIARVRRAFAFLRGAAKRVAALDVNAPLQPIGAQFPVELAPFAKAFNTGVQRLYLAIDRERRFSSNVAHELRTPLAEIRSSAESALVDGDGAASRRALQETIEATRRMQRSIDALLQLARLESGQDVPLSDPLDLRALLAESLRSAQRLPGGSSRAITACTGPAVWVSADVAILERIVANLLANAVEYADGEGAIACSVVSDDDGHAVWVSISNPVQGLLESDLQHFGQRFWRRQPEGGTAQHAGLGLALSLGLAQAHGLQLLFAVAEGRLHARLGPLLPL